jgi:hypothetical protein
MRLLCWLVVTLFLAWGTMLVMSPDPLGSTPVASASRYFPAEHYIIGVVTLMAAVLGAYGIYRGLTLLLLPLAVMLTLAAMNSVDAVWQGHYADGVERPRLFILADQLPIILLAAYYYVAVLREVKWTRS